MGLSRIGSPADNSLWFQVHYRYSTDYPDCDVSRPNALILK